MNKQKVLDELEAALVALSDQLGDLLAQTDDKAERRALLSRHSTLRDTYFKALVADLRDFNDTVLVLFDDLKAVRSELDEALEDLRDTPRILRLATEMIKLGGAIIVAAAV